MIRRYDYYCPANGETLEAKHSWSIKLHTWGELCDLLCLHPGETPAGAPVRKLISAPTLFRSPGDSAEIESPEQEGISGGSPGLHPIGCSCGCTPFNSGIAAFQEKLKNMSKPDGETHDL